jgi:hypothetical protein
MTMRTRISTADKIVWIGIAFFLIAVALKMLVLWTGK